MARTSLYSTVVQKDYSFLNEMKAHALRINEQQIFSHIFMGRYKEEDIIEFLEDLKSIKERFQKERRHIAQFSGNYNSSFATDNNECFSVVLEFCNLLKETLKSSMVIFREFCKKKTHKRIYKDGKQVKLSVLTHSDLGARYTQTLIPFEDDALIPPLLRKLSNLLMAFFAEIVDVIGICKEVLREEMMILQDYPRLKKIYDNTIDELEAFGCTVICCPDSIDKIKDPMTREMLQTETDKWNEILSKYYHKRTRGEFVEHLLIYNAFKAKYKNVPTEIERNIWGNDWGIIAKVRIALKYFDEMDPKGSINNKVGKHRLKGKSVAMLMKWCGITDEDRRKGAFMKYFNDKYKGEYLPIGDNAVYEAFNSWEGDDYPKFVKQLDKLVEEKMKIEGVAA